MLEAFKHILNPCQRFDSARCEPEQPAHTRQNLIAREVKGCLMILLPIQRIDPVVQIIFEASIQADVQEEKVEPAEQVR